MAKLEPIQKTSIDPYPQASWRQFFEGLGDQKDNIIENQPSWAPSNIKYISNGDLDVYEK